MKKLLIFLFLFLFSFSDVYSYERNITITQEGNYSYFNTYAEKQTSWSGFDRDGSLLYYINFSKVGKITYFALSYTPDGHKLGAEDDYYNNINISMCIPISISGTAKLYNRTTGVDNVINYMGDVGSYMFNYMCSDIMSFVNFDITSTAYNDINFSNFPTSVDYYIMFTGVKPSGRGGGHNCLDAICEGLKYEEKFEKTFSINDSSKYRFTVNDVYYITINYQYDDLLGIAPSLAINKYSTSAYFNVFDSDNNILGVFDQNENDLSTKNYNMPVNRTNGVYINLSLPGVNVNEKLLSNFPLDVGGISYPHANIYFCNNGWTNCQYDNGTGSYENIVESDWNGFINSYCNTGGTFFSGMDVYVNNYLVNSFSLGDYLYNQNYYLLRTDMSNFILNYYDFNNAIVSCENYFGDKFNYSRTFYLNMSQNVIFPEYLQLNISFRNETWNEINGVLNIKNIGNNYNTTINFSGNYNVLLENISSSYTISYYDYSGIYKNVSAIVLIRDRDLYDSIFYIPKVSSSDDYYFSFKVYTKIKVIDALTDTSIYNASIIIKSYEFNDLNIEMFTNPLGEQITILYCNEKFNVTINKTGYIKISEDMTVFNSFCGNYDYQIIPFSMVETGKVLYGISVNVFDDSSFEPIENVLISINSEDYQYIKSYITNMNGNILVWVPENNYTFKFSHENYSSFTYPTETDQYININESLNFKVFLSMTGTPGVIITGNVSENVADWKNYTGTMWNNLLAISGSVFIAILVIFILINLSLKKKDYNMSTILLINMFIVFIFSEMEIMPKWTMLLFVMGIAVVIAIKFSKMANLGGD